MKYIFPLLLVSIFLFSCEKDDHPGYPSCLEPIIADLANHHCDSTANVSKYRLKLEILYVIYPGFCGPDFGYDVIDQDCEMVGYLEGFGGNKIINGVDFYEHAQLISIIWQAE